MNKKIKIILVIFIIILILSLGYIYLIKNKEIDTSLWPDYYKDLAKQCKKATSYHCCMASVNNMFLGNYQLVPQVGCPEGYRDNMFKCIDSFTWCEPIKNLIPKNNSELYSCNEDSDCIFVEPKHCCGCYGEINKKYADYWHSLKYESCEQDISCSICRYYPNDLDVKCKEKQCIATEKITGKFV